MKDKKAFTINNNFQGILDKFRPKSNEIWVDNGSEFYNRSLKSWLQDNGMKMYSTHNGGKSVEPERFLRTSKYVYVYKCAYNIVHEYNNVYHKTIKMNPSDVKASTYINFEAQNYDKDPKFGIGDHVRIAKYKNVFAKRYTLIGL